MCRRRTRWNRDGIDEGVALVDAAARRRRPGTYQIQAAIAACHSTSPHAEATDWRRIASLYGELVRFEPTPVVEANRAVAVAMAEGPEAGLLILHTLAGNAQMERWAQLHIARADLLARLQRDDEAVVAYQRALELEPPPAERAFIAERIRTLTSRPPAR